jgi:hypothetical protein
VRRFVQSLLALALCVTLAGSLGILYGVAALLATIIALMSGMYIALAIGAGLVWPVLALAFVLHITRETSRRAAQGAAASTAPSLWGPEPILPGIEDPKGR